MVTPYSKKIMHIVNCDSGVCVFKGDSLHVFLGGQMSGLVDIFKFNIGVSAHTTNVIKVKLCMMILHTEFTCLCHFQ